MTRSAVAYHAAPGPPSKTRASRRDNGRPNKTLFIRSRCVSCVTVHSVDGPVLNLTRISRFHMGAYLCIASNGVPPSVSKRIMLVVNCEYADRYPFYFRTRCRHGALRGLTVLDAAPSRFRARRPHTRSGGGVMILFRARAAGRVVSRRGGLALRSEPCDFKID